MLEGLTFITGNQAKAERVSHHLQFPLNHKKIDLAEIQSLDPIEVIDHKVREAYSQLGVPVLVEDTVLVFRALGRLPGPLIKWFYSELGNEGLCRLLNGYPTRDSLAQVHFGLYDGNKVEVFKGEISGVIVRCPRGKEHFGWDPIFQPDGYTQTWAEMTDSRNEKALNTTSMRRMALRKLQDYLLR